MVIVSMETGEKISIQDIPTISADGAQPDEEFIYPMEEYEITVELNEVPYGLMQFVRPMEYPLMQPVRTHRRTRVQKKWIKRYGLKPIGKFEQNRIMQRMKG